MTAYLLRSVAIGRPNQVWSADITYIPMPSGFVYPAATIDWFSRFVVAWKLSNALDGSFCQEMLAEPLGRGTPEVFNTDRGVQFTARAWTSRLEDAGVAVSMDGKGRCPDNIFVERLWRSVTYEYAYPCGPATVLELESGLRDYFGFYNDRRIHQSLDYRTPAEVHRPESRSPPLGEARTTSVCSRANPLRGMPDFGLDNGVHHNRRRFPLLVTEEIAAAPPRSENLQGRGLDLGVRDQAPLFGERPGHRRPLGHRPCVPGHLLDLERHVGRGRRGYTPLLEMKISVRPSTGRLERSPGTSRPTGRLVR